MQLLGIPVYDCLNESDVEQKFIYPLLTHPSFLDIPNKAILTKRSLGTLSFIEKSDLPRNYVPDYVVFFSGVPTCVIEAKAPDVPVDLALQEARLYGQSMNSHFPSGTNPVRVVAGCNGRQLLVGNWDSVDHDKFSVQELVIGSKHLTRLREVMGSNRLIQHAKLIQRATPHRGFARPSQQMDPQLFRDRVQPNALAPYLTPLYEMFFRAEDPEKIQLIIERAYVDTAELRQYDEVLNAILRQIERVQETSYQTIQTD